MSFPVVVPDWAMYSGDTFSQTYVLKSDGTAINLVTQGWTSWVAKWKPYVGSTVVTLTVDTTSAASGQITITATSAQTAAMDGPGLWDVQATNGSTVRTWLRGKTSFIQDV